jgi:hypothetical protein
MQRHWVAAVPPERFAAERAYARDTFPLDPAAGPGDGPAIGDRVALVAVAEPPVLFGLGERRGSAGEVRYTHRLFDEPPALDGSVTPGLTEVTAERFHALTGGVGADRRVDADRSEWFVMVALPIEAGSKAEAVREFWTYVDKLGPSQLPAFVWPRGDELAMQAYLLGERVNLDPEEDEVDDRD